MMHPSSVVPAVVTNSRRPLVKDDSIECVGINDRWVVDRNFKQHRRPGLLNHERSQGSTFFASLTKSNRNLGQREGPTRSRFTPEQLSRSNSFCSIASGSVNGVFGDSGDSDLPSSDDECNNDTTRRQNSKQVPWITLEEISNCKESQTIAIFDLKNKHIEVSRGSQSKLENLSVTNSLEPDDCLDSFCDLENLDESVSSMMAQRLTAPMASKGRETGRKSSRESVARDCDTRHRSQKEQTNVKLQTPNEPMHFSPSKDALRKLPFIAPSPNVGLAYPNCDDAAIAVANDEYPKRTGGNRFEPHDFLHNSQKDSLESNSYGCPIGTKAIAPKPTVPAPTGSSWQNLRSQSNDAISNESTKNPIIRQFALFSIQRHELVASFSDESLFLDTGPRHLHAFAMSKCDTVQTFPPSHFNQKSIPSEKLAKSCVPGGLRVRLIPRVAVDGARRLGWLDKDGDCGYVFSVPGDSNERYHHGVAIRVREVVALPVHEMFQFVRTFRVRQRRRWAATKICRWYKILQRRASIVSEALRLSRYPKHPKDFCRVLTMSDIHRLERKINNSLSSRARPNVDNVEKAEDCFSSEIYNILDDALQRFLKEATFHRQAQNIHLERVGASRKLTLANLRAVKEIKRFPASTTRLIKSARMADPSVSAKVEATDRRFSSERMSFTPSSRTVTDSTDTYEDYPIVIKKLAMEAMKASELAEVKGFVVVVEKCYALVGEGTNEQVLLLNLLQQLVDHERVELQRLRSHLVALNPSQRSRLGKVWDASERRVHSFLEQQRSVVLFTSMEQLHLTENQKLVAIPNSQLEAIRGLQQYFDSQLSLPIAIRVKLPLPLPNIHQEWGIAKLLLTIGPQSLVQAVKVLLLEKSVLVLGERLDEITACCFALLELLKPFEWAHLVRPINSATSLDFLSGANHPFVAGLECSDFQQLAEMENRELISQAFVAGMSVINLATGDFHVTSQPGISQMLGVDHCLNTLLKNISSRLHGRVDHDITSPLSHFEMFVENGLSIRDRLSVRTVRNAFEKHLSRFCSDKIVIDSCECPPFGSDDADACMLTNPPELFMKSWISERLFFESFVRTKHFSSYFEKDLQHRKGIEQLRIGKPGQFIATWIFNRWTEQKLKNSSMDETSNNQHANLHRVL